MVSPCLGSRPHGGTTARGHFTSKSTAAVLCVGVGGRDDRPRRNGCPESERRRAHDAGRDDEQHNGAKCAPSGSPVPSSSPHTSSGVFDDQRRTVARTRRSSATPSCAESAADSRPDRCRDPITLLQARCALLGARDRSRPRRPARAHRSSALVPKNRLARMFSMSVRSARRSGNRPTCWRQRR